MINRIVMAHTSTRIYSDSTYGVEIADAQAVVPSSSHYIGGITTTGDINKWAKYKPVRSDILGILSDSDFQDAEFGLSFPAFGTGYSTSISDFLSSYSSGWTYLAPRGLGGGYHGANEWFRFHDYDEYESTAQCFLFEAGCTLPSRYTYGTSANGLDFSISLNSGNSLLGGISISDFKLGGRSGIPLSSMYFGLIFASGSTYKIITSNSTLSSYGGTSLHINESNNNGLDGLGDTSIHYMVYPILSVNARGNGSAVNVGNSSTETIIALPFESSAPYEFRQITSAATTTVTLSNASAYLGAFAKLNVSADVTLRSTDGTNSIGLLYCSIYFCNNIFT